MTSWKPYTQPLQTGSNTTITNFYIYYTKGDLKDEKDYLKELGKLAEINETITVIKYKAKVRYKRKKGHRQQKSLVKIGKI